MSTDSNIAEELREVLGRDDVDPKAEADRVDTVLADALGATAADELPKPVVRTSLPAVVLALLEIRDGERHGKALLEDFERAFGHQFSPGTVYPVLHDLDDDGVLTLFERDTAEKNYEFEDSEAAYTRIEQRAEQHAALARFLHASLEQLDTNTES